MNNSKKRKESADHRPEIYITWSLWRVKRKNEIRVFKCPQLCLGLKPRTGSFTRLVPKKIQTENPQKKISSGPRIIPHGPGVWISETTIRIKYYYLQVRYRNYYFRGFPPTSHLVQDTIFSSLDSFTTENYQEFRWTKWQIGNWKVEYNFIFHRAFLVKCVDILSLWAL